MTLHEYAQKILKDHGCDEHTYTGKMADHLLDDLKAAYKPGELDFPYIDVANAILEISKPEPIKRSPYRVIWDGDSFIDGADCDTFEQAKDNAIETLVDWMTEEQAKWKSDKPTQQEVENWNYMIFNTGSWIQKYNPETDDYYNIYLDDKDLEEIGWKEIPESEAR